MKCKTWQTNYCKICNIWYVYRVPLLWTVIHKPFGHGFINFKSNVRWNQSASFYIWKCAYCYQLTYCKDIAKDANILNMDNYGYSAGYLFHALTFIFKSEKHSCTKSYLFVCLHVIYFFISGSTMPVCFFLCNNGCKFWHLVVVWIWCSSKVRNVYTQDLGFLCNCYLLLKVLHSPLLSYQTENVQW